MAKIHCFLICLFLCNIFCNNAYKIPEQSAPGGSMIRNFPLEYKGPVFLINETDNPTNPFEGNIVDGGIELLRSFPPNVAHPRPIMQGFNSESPEDSEYFAVLVTPGTIAQSLIPSNTTITIPLHTLLIGASARIPWLLALKKQDHLEYFKSLQTIQPIPKIPFSRRRGKRQAHEEQQFGHGRFQSTTKKYDLLYFDDGKAMVENFISYIMKKLLMNNPELVTMIAEIVTSHALIH